MLMIIFIIHDTKNRHFIGILVPRKYLHVLVSRLFASHRHGNKIFDCIFTDLPYHQKPRRSTGCLAPLLANLGDYAGRD